MQSYTNEIASWLVAQPDANQFTSSISSECFTLLTIRVTSDGQ